MDSFVSHRLFEAGIWDSPRTSDGIQYLRAVEHGPERVRVCGRIFELDQSLHSFWLAAERATSGSEVLWHLHSDVLADSPRGERNAIEAFDSAEDLEWRVTLAGKGEVRDGALVVTSMDSDRSRPRSPR